MLGTNEMLKKLVACIIGIRSWLSIKEDNVYAPEKKNMCKVNLVVQVMVVVLTDKGDADLPVWGALLHALTQAPRLLPSCSSSTFNM